MKKVVKAIKEAIKDSSEIRLNIRLKRDGRFSSVTGTVQSLNVSLDGESYAVVKPTDEDRHVQSVLLRNVLALIKEDGKIVKA